MKTTAEFLQYVHYHVGRSIYIYGGQGQTPPELEMTQLQEMEVDDSEKPEDTLILKTTLIKIISDF